MIHICFALHDGDGRYSKNVGVAMCSIYKNTKSNVMVHLIHDESVSEGNIKLFQELSKLHNQEIRFYKISSERFISYKDVIKDKKTTVGTLFRLMIPEILPEMIKKVIYLDADIIVHMDISSLWNINIEKYALAARKDHGGSKKLADANMVSSAEYFNAGVMLMNLDYIRNQKFNLQMYLDFLHKHHFLDYADQDVLNYFFQKKIYYLEERYNDFTYLLRKEDNTERYSIYHFAGDFVHLEQMRIFDRLFFVYLFQTPWRTDDLIIDILRYTAQCYEKNLQLFQKIVSRLCSTECKKIIFGAKSELYEKISHFVRLSPKNDYYIDNNKNLYDKKNDGLNVYPPTKLLNEDNNRIVIIVLSNRYYKEISEQLTEYGFKENEDYFDGHYLLTKEQGGYGYLF